VVVDDDDGNVVDDDDDDDDYVDEHSAHVVPKPALNWGRQASDSGTGGGRG
jgi:hypothetical protein